MSAPLPDPGPSLPEAGVAAAGLLAAPFLPLVPPFLGPEESSRLRRFLQANPQPLSGYSFGALLAWAEPFDYTWTFGEPDTLLVACTSWTGPAGKRGLLQPVGSFSGPLQQALLAFARTQPAPFTILGASGEFLARYPRFCEQFQIEECRDMANYVYAATDLAELKGGRYSKKRNHVAQARRDCPWTVELLGPAQAPACLEVVDDIAAQRRPEAGGTLEHETQALRGALRRFGELGLGGVLLRVAGKPSAFAVFEAMSATTAVILFERALPGCNGLYQVVNQETAKILAGRGFELINREEDLGDPGLRQAKLSYYPWRLETSYTLSLRC